MGLGLQTQGNVPFDGGHGPGFPALIGSLILVFGRDVGALAWAIRLLAVLNALLAYFLVRRVSGPAAGLIAAALLTLFGSINLAFNIDTVLLAFCLLLLLALLGAIRRNSSALAFLSGVLLGTSILTKETALANAPLALLAVLLLGWELRGALWHYLGVVLACLLWWVWYYSATGGLYLIDRLPPSLQLPLLVATATLLVVGTLAYTTGAVDWYLASERRRRRTGWFVVLTWTVSLTALALYAGAPALAEASSKSLRLYLADLLPPTIVIVPVLILVGGYTLWRATQGEGPWTLLALALLFQLPVCLLVVEQWAPRQYQVLGAFVFCALSALVVDAAGAAWRRRSYSTRFAGALVAATLVILLPAASLVRVQALLHENLVGGSSERHEVAPQATRMVDWMTEHVREQHNILITPAYSLNRYFMFLDGRQHEWTFLRMDQGRCEPRPNGQMRCESSALYLRMTVPGICASSGCFPHSRIKVAQELCSTQTSRTAYLSPKGREPSTRYLAVRVSGLLDTNFGEGISTKLG